MKLSTTIIRTPFGMSSTAESTRVFTDTDLWKRLRREFCAKHFEQVSRAVAGLINNPISISSGYRHRDDIGEWWTVISHDEP